MTVTSHELVFRRFVCRLEEEISKEQRQQLVYIRLYPLREKYRDASTLDVLAKLEADGVFDSHHVEGLLEIARDIDHRRLEKEVREFIKRRGKEEKKAVRRTNSNPQERCGELMSPEELQLRSILEVALTQLTVLMRQIDTFKEKIEVVSRTKERRKVSKVMREAGETAMRLASTLTPVSGDFDGRRSESTSPPKSLENPCYESVEDLPSMLTVHKSSVAMQEEPTPTGEEIQHQPSPTLQRPRKPLKISKPDPLRPLPQSSLQEDRPRAQSLHSNTDCDHRLVQRQRQSFLSMKAKSSVRPDDESKEAVTSQFKTSTATRRGGPPPPVRPKPAIAPKKLNLKQTSTGSPPQRSDSITFGAKYPLQPEAGDYTGGSTGDSGFEDIEKFRQSIGPGNPSQNFEAPEQSHYYTSLLFPPEGQDSEAAHDYMVMQGNEAEAKGMQTHIQPEKKSPHAESGRMQTQSEEPMKPLPALTPSILSSTSRTEPHTTLIDPVEVICCDSSGGIYHNPLHGVTLRIPEEAIPHGEYLEISIGVCLHGDFRFSNGLSPVSAIVWLCNCKSTDDAVNLEMKFMKANHKNLASQALQFLPADGETDFTSVPNKGILYTKHFCYLCITAGVSSDQLRKRRFCITSAIPKSITAGSTVFFYILYFLETCIRSLETQLADGYSLEEPRVFRMSQRAEAITAEYHLSTTPKPVVLTLQPTRISQDMIDFWQLHQSGELELMEKMKMYPPSMRLKFGDLSSCEEQVVIVSFTGTQEPADQMKIGIIVPSSNDKELLCDTKLSRPIPCRRTPTLKDTPTLRQLWQLDTESEETPVCLLAALAPQWMELGIAMDFDPQGRHLQLVREECCYEGPMACCRRIVVDWLCGKGSYQPPTWENMLKILRDIHEENLEIALRKLMS